VLRERRAAWPQRTRRPRYQKIAAITALHGIVSTHAQTIVAAIPQRTAESFFVAPTPTMAPVIVCVVDTGMPSAVAKNSVAAPPVWAQKPPTGRSLVIF